MNGLNIKVEADSEKLQEKERERKWEVEDAVRTILKAEEIKQDAELMKYVKPELEKHTKAAINAAKVLYGENNNESKSN